MLNEFVFTKIEDHDIGNIWFQQDGATSHAAEPTLDFLSSVFKDFFEKLFMAIFIYSQCICRKSAERKPLKKYFFVIQFFNV